MNKIFEPKTFDNIVKLIKDSPNGLKIKSEGDFHDSKSFVAQPLDEKNFALIDSEDYEVKVTPYKALYDVENFGSGMFYSFNLFTWFDVEVFEVAQ